MVNPTTSQRFPAILIGGPPHAGKSALAYGLQKMLAKVGLQCYLLRAAPDGEGNWSHESEPDLARSLQRKGTYTSTWIEHMRRDIAQRPLPYLVDVGGKPKSDQEEFFGQCTHAILLVKDAASEAEWLALMDKYNVPVIAVLVSQLEGESRLQATHPQVRGIITHLKWGQLPAGPVFEAVLNRVKALFTYSDDEIVIMHQAEAPTDMVIVLKKLYQHLNPQRSDSNWQPSDLPAMLNYLPQDLPLGLYGVGPIWLYVAVASYVHPAPFYQFDARRGWVMPVSIDPQATPSPVNVTIQETDTYLHLTVELVNDYLHYQSKMNISLPVLPSGKGIILEGKGPAWLYTGLALHYHQASWIAIYQPQLEQAVVTFATEGSLYNVGNTFLLDSNQSLID